MEQQKKPFYKRWWFIALVIIFVLGAIGSKKTEQELAATSEQTAPASTATSNQYVEVFKFSGNGSKKSEPFTITGSRFKIAYECSGDPSATLCTAFVFKVGSNLPQGVMNSVQATKDETVIYTSMAGKGEYYIDANVMGNFKMIVYDYK